MLNLALELIKRMKAAEHNEEDNLRDEAQKEDDETDEEMKEFIL